MFGRRKSSVGGVHGGRDGTSHAGTVAGAPSNNHKSNWNDMRERYRHLSTRYPLHAAEYYTFKAAHLSKHRKRRLDREKTRAIIQGKREKLVSYLACSALRHPNSAIRITIDILLVVLTLYSVMMVPYYLGFGLEPYPWGFLFSLEVLIDVAFGADLTLQFFSWRVAPVTGDTLLDCGSNARNYLCSWFVLDLLSTVPFDRLVLTSGSTALRTLRVLRIVRLLKLLKLTRLVKLQDRAQRLARVIGVGVYNSVGGVAQLLFLIGFATHIIACLFHGLTLFTLFGEVPERVVSEGMDEEVQEGAPLPELFGVEVDGSSSVLNGGTSWATLYGEMNATDGQRYASAVYYTVTSLLSVGPGDVISQNDTERLFSVILMILGACLFGVVVAGVSRVVEQMSASSLAFQRKMNEVNEWASSRKLPRRLRQRIGRFYQYLLSRVSLFSEQSILQDLSTSLRNEVVAWSNGKIVYGMEPFQDADPTLVTLLVTRMRPLFHMRQDVVFREEEQGRDVFFLVRGAVQLVAADPGEAPLVYLRKQARRKRRDELLELLGFFDDEEVGRESTSGAKDEKQSRREIKKAGGASSRRSIHHVGLSGATSSVPGSELSGDLGGSLLDVQYAYLAQAPRKAKRHGQSMHGAAMHNARSRLPRLSAPGRYHQSSAAYSDRTRTGTSATLGTVDPRHVPRVEQEASNSDSGSQRSGWTGYSFLTDRPGRAEEKARPPLSKAERNERAAREAQRRRRMSLLRDAHQNGLPGAQSSGHDSRPEYAAVNRTGKSFGDEQSIVAPGEQDRDLDSAEAGSGKQLPAIVSAGGDSTGPAAPHGSPMPRPQPASTRSSTGKCDDLPLVASNSASDFQQRNQAEPGKMPGSGGDMSMPSKARYTSEEGVGKEGIAAGSGGRRRPKHDLWTAGVSVDLRSSSKQAMERIKDSKSFRIIASMQQAQAIGHAAAKADAVAALMRRKAMEEGSLGSPGGSSGGAGRPPASPARLLAPEVRRKGRGRERSTPSDSSMDMSQIALGRTQSWTQAAYQMKAKASKLRMDFARSAQGIHSMLGDDLDRDQDLRYRKQGKVKQSDALELGMVREEEEGDEEESDGGATRDGGATNARKATEAGSSIGSSAYEVDLAGGSALSDKALGLHSTPADGQAKAKPTHPGAGKGMVAQTLEVHPSQHSPRADEPAEYPGGDVGGTKELLAAPSDQATGTSGGLTGDSYRSKASAVGTSSPGSTEARHILAPRMSAAGGHHKKKSFGLPRHPKPMGPAGSFRAGAMQKRRSDRLTPKMSFKLFGSVMARPHVPGMGQSRLRLNNGSFHAAQAPGAMDYDETNSSLNSSDTGELELRVDLSHRRAVKAAPADGPLPPGHVDGHSTSIRSGMTSASGRGVPPPVSRHFSAGTEESAKSSPQPVSGKNEQAQDVHILAVGSYLSAEYQRGALSGDPSNGVEITDPAGATGVGSSTIEELAKMSSETDLQQVQAAPRPTERSGQWGKLKSGRLVGAPAGNSLMDAPSVSSREGYSSDQHDSSLKDADAYLARPSESADVHVAAEPMSLAQARQVLAAEARHAQDPSKDFSPKGSMQQIVSRHGSAIMSASEHGGHHPTGSAILNEGMERNGSYGASLDQYRGPGLVAVGSQSRRTMVSRWPSNESIKEREAMLLLGESSSSDESSGEHLNSKSRRSSAGGSSLIHEFLVPEVESELQKAQRLEASRKRYEAAAFRKAQRKRERAKAKVSGGKSARGYSSENDDKLGETAGSSPAGTQRGKPLQRPPPRRSSNRPMTFAEAKRLREHDSDGGSSNMSRRLGSKRNIMSMSSRRLINTRDASVRHAWKHGPLYAMAVFTDGRHFGDVGPLLGCKRLVGARASTVCDMYTITIEELLLVLYDFPTKLRELRKLAKQRRNAYRRSRIMLAAYLHVGAATRQELCGKQEAEKEMRKAYDAGKLKPASEENRAMFEQQVPKPGGVEIHDIASSLPRVVPNARQGSLGNQGSTTIETEGIGSKGIPGQDTKPSSDGGRKDYKSTPSTPSHSSIGGQGSESGANGTVVMPRRGDAHSSRNPDDETLPPSQYPGRRKPTQGSDQSGVRTSTGGDGTIETQKSWARYQYESLTMSAKHIGSAVATGVNLLASTLRDDDDLEVDDHDQSPEAVARRAAIESVAPAPKAVLPHVLLNDAPANVSLLPEGLLPTHEEEEDDDQLLLRTLRQVEVDSGHIEAIGISCCASCLSWYVNHCGCECRFSGRCWCPAWCTSLLALLQCTWCCRANAAVAPGDAGVTHEGTSSGGYAAANASRDAAMKDRMERDSQRCSVCASCITCQRATENDERAALLEEYAATRTAEEAAGLAPNAAGGGFGAVFGAPGAQTIRVPKTAVQREASSQMEQASKSTSTSSGLVAPLPKAHDPSVSSPGNKRLRVRRGSVFTAQDGTKFSASLRKIGFDPNAADDHTEEMMGHGGKWGGNTRHRGRRDGGEVDSWEEVEKWLCCRLDARCCCDDDGSCCTDPTSGRDAGLGGSRVGRSKSRRRKRVAHDVYQRHLCYYTCGTQLIEMASGPIVEDVETPAALQSRWIIWSDSSAKARWDLLVLATVLFTMFQVPFYIGFDLDIDVGSAMYVLERVIDCLFVIDIFLSARTTYVDEESQLQVTVPSLMCWNYVTGRVWVDLLSSVPWDLFIPLLVEGGADARALRSFKLLRTLRLVRLLRLLRLLRLFKVSSYVKGLSVSMFMSPGMVRLLTLSFQVLFSAHMLGCLWHFVTIVDVDERHSWLTNIDPSLQVGAGLSSRYLASIYWAVSTITTVGYGDIVPHTDSETIAAIFVTVIGASMFGYIIGSIAAVLTRLDPARSLSEDKIRQVDEYLRDKNLDPALAHRVLGYYDKLMKRKSAFNEDAILAELSGSLRRAVVLHLNRDIIGSISFFRGASEGLIYHVVSVLRPQFAAPAEFVFREGEQPFDMFFLTDGVCEVVETVEAAPSTRAGRKARRRKSSRRVGPHSSSGSGVRHSVHSSGGIAPPSPSAAGHRRNSMGSGGGPILSAASRKSLGGRFLSGGMPAEGSSMGAAAGSSSGDFGASEVAVAHLEVVHEQLNPGSYFGELSLLLGIRQPVGVRAKTHCSLFALSREELKDLVDRFPLFGKRVEQSMRRFLRSVVRDRRRRRKMEESDAPAGSYGD